MTVSRSAIAAAGLIAGAAGFWLAYRWIVADEAPFGPVWRLGPAAGESARALSRDPPLEIVFASVPRPSACIVKVEPPSAAFVQRDADGLTTLREGEVVRVTPAGGGRVTAVELRLRTTGEGRCWIQSRTAPPSASAAPR